MLDSGSRGGFSMSKGLYLGKVQMKIWGLRRAVDRQTT